MDWTELSAARRQVYAVMGRPDGKGVSFRLGFEPRKRGGVSEIDWQGVPDGRCLHS